MHTIAEATGGTFAFIENEAVIQDSFAQCIGGLLSVAAQEARVAVECVCPGVRVRSIKSGRYKSRVNANGRTAAVEVGELYADEERRFLLFVDVPKAGATDDVTWLMKVSCTYRDVARVADLAHWVRVGQRCNCKYNFILFFYFLAFFLWYKAHFPISGWAVAHPVHPLPPPLGTGVQ